MERAQCGRCSQELPAFQGRTLETPDSPNPANPVVICGSSRNAAKKTEKAVKGDSKKAEKAVAGDFKKADKKTDEKGTSGQAAPQQPKAKRLFDLITQYFKENLTPLMLRAIKAHKCLYAECSPDFYNKLITDTKA